MQSNAENQRAAVKDTDWQNPLPILRLFASDLPAIAMDSRASHQRSMLWSNTNAEVTQERLRL